MNTIEHKKKLISEIETLFLGVNEDEIDRLLYAIMNANKVFVTGAGRVGLIMRAFAMRLMHTGLKPTYYVGEISTTSIQKGDLLVVGSGSACTKTSTLFSKIAKEKEAAVFLVTTNLEGEMVERSDGIVYIGEKNAHNMESQSSVQDVGARFEQTALMVLDYAVIKLAEEHNIGMDIMAYNHANLE